MFETDIETTCIDGNIKNRMSIRPDDNVAFVPEIHKRIYDIYSGAKKYRFAKYSTFVAGIVT